MGPEQTSWFDVVFELCDKIIGRKRPNLGIEEFRVKGNRQLWIGSRQQVPPLNSQKKYKIQALIAEIDEVLSKPVPRLPWTGSMDSVHQRQLLERVRIYLVSPDSKLVAAKAPSNSVTLSPEVLGATRSTEAAHQQAVDEILLAVTGEISHLREELMQPLQEDIQALRQEQEALVREIKLLEAKREQQQSLAQQQANQQQIISEFLQALTSRLQETLDRGVLQTNQLLPGAQTPAPDSLGLDRHQQTLPEHGEMTAAERLQQMQLFQAQADRLMMSLDSTMSLVFETLEGNLQSYQESLSQGLEKMHGLGQQSEAMFAALVNHLASQLGREASSHVQQPIELSASSSATSTAVSSTPDSPMLPPVAAPDSIAGNQRSNALVEGENIPESQFGEQERLPYAGTEMSPQFGQLKRDRASTQFPISLPDLAENLFGYESLGDLSATTFPGAESEDPLPETGEDVRDLYASLFAGEDVAELELEDFAIENTENAAGSTELTDSETWLADETAEPVIATADLLANLLEEDESAADFVVDENSDFVIPNAVDELTLDTEDLFEPEVAVLPQVSASLAPTSEPQIDLEKSQNAERAPENPARPDSAASDRTRPLPPPPPPPAFRTAPETTSTPPSPGPRVPSARDVQTGEFGTGSQRLDDAYIQASPDEDLLPVEPSSESADRTLNWDNNTLELLEADLYTMEGGEKLSQRRSPPSSPLHSGLLADAAGGNPENPFAGAAAEELGSLDDLFAEVLDNSSDDGESLAWEEELDAELFNEGAAESNLSLDDILASLEIEETAIDSPSQESETASGKVKKKPNSDA